MFALWLIALAILYAAIALYFFALDVRALHFFAIMFGLCSFVTTLAFVIVGAGYILGYPWATVPTSQQWDIVVVGYSILGILLTPGLIRHLYDLKNRRKMPHEAYPEILAWQKFDKFKDPHSHTNYYIISVDSGHRVYLASARGDSKASKVVNLKTFLRKWNNISLRERNLEPNDHYSTWLDTNWEARQLVRKTDNISF